MLLKLLMYSHYIVHLNLILNHLISFIQQQNLTEKTGQHELSSTGNLNLINVSFISIENQSHSDFEDFCQILQSSKTKHLNRLGRKDKALGDEVRIFMVISVL